VLSGLVLRQRRRQVLVRYDGAHRRRLGRGEQPGSRAGEHGHDEEVADRDADSQRSGDQRDVQHQAGRTRGAHQAATIGAIGEHPCREEGGDESDEMGALGGRGPER